MLPMNPDIPMQPVIPDGGYIMTDPAAVLLEFTQQLRDKPKPNLIAVHEEVWSETDAALKRWNKWAARVVKRRSLLSGRYGKRRAQQKHGVAAGRHLDLRMAREWLSDKDGQG